MAADDFVLAMTGASGAVYGVRLLDVLLGAGRVVHLVLSPAATQVIEQELDRRVRLDAFRLADLMGAERTGPGAVCYHDYRDFRAGIASGSFRTAGMVICPCSMGTAAAVAHGLSQNLIHRAADVHLKERRTLVLVRARRRWAWCSCAISRRAPRRGRWSCPQCRRSTHSRGRWTTRLTSSWAASATSSASRTTCSSAGARARRVRRRGEASLHARKLPIPGERPLRRRTAFARVPIFTPQRTTPQRIPLFQPDRHNPHDPHFSQVHSSRGPKRNRTVASGSSRRRPSFADCRGVHERENGHMRDAGEPGMGLCRR